MKIIPAEIEAALEQSYGFILLIKGKAGTGKTTLALEILNSVKNSLYISTRITPKLLYTQFPWIKASLAEEKIIDATAFDVTHPLLFTDESFFQSLKIRQLPDFIKIMVSKMNAPTGTIVIDSWDAIATLGDTKWGKPHDLLANYIIDLSREKAYNLILVAETEKESYLDYLVDGIICLKESLIDTDKIIRQLKIIKVRSIGIKQHSYVFTLNQGRFNIFSPTERISFKNFKFPSVIDDTNSKISTGSPDLDSILDGGFERGTIILYEFEPHLGIGVSSFILNTIFNFLIKKRGIVGSPPSERDITLEIEAIKHLLADKNIFDSNVRILDIGKEKESLPSYIIRFIPKNNLDYFTRIRALIQELLEHGVNSPILIILSLNNITFRFDFDEIKRNTLFIVSQIKKSGNILLITANQEEKYIEELKKVVDIHLIIKKIDRKVVLYGINPKTNVFAVNFETEKGIYCLNLIPIV